MPNTRYLALNTFHLKKILAKQCRVQERDLMQKLLVGQIDMNIKFKKQQHQIQLIYTPSFNPNVWIFKRFEEKELVCFKKTFSFEEHLLVYPKKDNIYKTGEGNDINEWEECVFKFAELDHDYWIISKDILGTENDVLFTQDIFVQKEIYLHANPKFFKRILEKITKLFVAEKEISIFKNIDELCDEQIIIGGNRPEAIPVEDFALLIEKFPTTHEKKLYTESRISNILGSYLGTMTDAEQKLQNYFKRKNLRLNNIAMQKKDILIPELYESELQKYIGIRDIFKKKLSSNINADEKEWQIFIKNFLCLIFPQYIGILKNVRITENYSKECKTNREIDFVLVGADGYIDIIEIKKPFEENCILSTVQYRDNFFPHKELSGAIMQAEKYVFYLNSLGHSGEKKLTEKYKNDLPENIELKIRNPKYMIILGRSKRFNNLQKSDFEIIKRKYSNVINILTYDDLLFNLNNMIESLKIKTSR